MNNDNLLEALQRSNMELTLAYEATVEGWVRALELRDRGLKVILNASQN
ncbi:MAG TPA: hypothetical protein VMJ90_04725 [Anaerolineales bacterium]|nr:hypothetical protein [Anaerolineales bacterium]